MPCNMGGGDNTVNIEKRLFELEEALCGFCQSIPDEKFMHPQLKDWFERHKKRKGCSLYKSKIW